MKLLASSMSVLRLREQTCVSLAPIALQPRQSHQMQQQCLTDPQNVQNLDTPPHSFQHGMAMLAVSWSVKLYVGLSGWMSVVRPMLPAVPAAPMLDFF